MSKLECVVLEYAPSDLDESGTPFLIVVRDEVELSPFVQLYILKNWEVLIPPTCHSDAARIADFIFAVRQQQFREREAISAFFRSIQRLNMGPLRTSFTGSVERSDAEARWPEITAGRRDVLLCDSDDFDSILSVTVHNSESEGIYRADETVS